jgi:hypothetical protein
MSKNVYLKAAEIMDNKAHPCGCCNAIAKAVNGLTAENGVYCGDLGSGYHVAKEKMKVLFGRDGMYWWREPPRDREHRVLALCFMAAIAGRLGKKTRRNSE